MLCQMNLQPTRVKQNSWQNMNTGTELRKKWFKTKHQTQTKKTSQLTLMGCLQKLRILIKPSLLGIEETQQL